MVIVEGFDAFGNIVIKDPWEATSYKMTRPEFIDNAWTGRALFDRDR